MTPEQYEQFVQSLKANQVPDDRLSENRVFLRGFNDGVEFALRMARQARGEPERTPQEEIR